jgi:WD40 repeat protein
MSASGRLYLGLRVACLATAMALSACTGTTPEHPTPAVSRVGGTILAAAEPGASPVVGFKLPSETVDPVAALGTVPTATYTVTHASAPDPSGGVDLLASDRHGVVGVYRVAPGGETSRSGPTLRIGTPKPYASLDVANGVAAVADCGAIRTLTLSRPSGWTTVGTGCWAALSPDGASLAYSSDGSTIEERRLPDGRPRQLLDARQLASDFPPGSPPPSLVGPPSWGDAGLAFAVRSGSNVAVLVREPSGKLETVVHEERSTSQLPRMAWQPHGDLLAIADDMGPEGGVLRIFDPTTGELRAIGLDLLGFSQPVWSPDGRSLASLTSAKALIVFDVAGDWRLRVETQWRDLLAWGA